MNLNRLKHELQQFYGTEKYYYTLVRNSLYTDGMKHFLENAGTNGAYWLYDIIQTEVFDVLKKRNIPDKYYLKLSVQGSKADIVLTTYQNKELYRRHMTFTDIDDGEIEFYVGFTGQALITCVPSED